MATTAPFIGSGVFVQARYWTCPIHERPVTHWCDCEFCSWEAPECCAAAEWRDVLDADGNAVKRELNTLEAYLLKEARRSQDSLPGGFPGIGEVEWQEDALMPRIER